MIIIKKSTSAGSNLDTSDATVTVNEILDSETAYVNGAKITGTMPNIGAETITPDAAGALISEGYHDGTGGVIAEPNFIGSNIKDSVNIWGVTGTYETPIDGTATPSQVFKSTTFYSTDATSKQTGTFEPSAADIKSGTTLAGVLGTFTGDGDATANDIIVDKIAYVNGAKVVGGIPIKTGDIVASGNTTSGTTVKLLAPEGYYNGTNVNVTITDEYLIPENIKSGVTILGVLGTYTGA